MNSRVIGKHKVTVKLVKFDEAKSICKGLMVELLPAHFEATGLPYKVNYVVNKKRQITKLEINVTDKSFALSQTKLPLGRLRSMALIEARTVWQSLDQDSNDKAWTLINEAILKKLNKEGQANE